MREWTGFGGKKLWDWLKLLSSLAIPVVLAGAGLMFSAQQDQRQRAIEDERIRQDREIMEQSSQNTAVQAYLDQMNQLLLDGHLRSSPEGSEVRTLAQARTLAALGRLDPDRKETLLRFLYEANLIDKENPVVSLDGANLSGLDLSGNNLSGGPYLVETHLATYLGGDRKAGYLPPELARSLGAAAADLSGADLSSANLSGALLAGVDLSGANLSGAQLQNAFLSEWTADAGAANLEAAFLRDASLDHIVAQNANLSGAVLIGSSLNGADLRNADLSAAHLRDANLSNATLNRAVLSRAMLVGTQGVTEEQLAECNLASAILPEKLFQQLRLHTPNLYALTLEEAQEEAGDDFELISFEQTSGRPRGQILGRAPEARTAVLQGEKIYIDVSSGLDRSEAAPSDQIQSAGSSKYPASADRPFCVGCRPAQAGYQAIQDATLALRVEVPSE